MTVSIIIPVYNAEAFIARCLKSVSDQSYKDWECIIVNDGSTDGSLCLCEQWAQKDTRFNVISQTNGGVSSARNIGMTQAKGDYVCFIDVDDWVDTDYVENLVSASCGVELVVGGMEVVTLGGQKEKKRVPQSGVCHMEASDERYFAMMNENSLLYGPCNKLYSKRIIAEYGLSFLKDCAYGEDLLFNYAYMNHIKSIIMVDCISYHYIKNEGSLSERARFDAFVNDYKLWRVRTGFMKDKGMFGPVSQKVMYTYLWGQIYNGLFDAPLHGNKWSYLKSVLSIDEIDDLKQRDELISCSEWIKQAILNRNVLFLYIYFKMRQWISRS